MFPDDITLPDVGSTVTADSESAGQSDDDHLGNSLAFDYEKERFVLVDGANKFPTDTEAVKQWITLFLLTERGKFAVYDDDFGWDYSDLIGYRTGGNGYRISEVTRRCTEGIIYGCPAVESCYNWSFTREGFSFNVKLKTGEEVTINV